jgi:predicted  nucleic acid-binding Zn-ribbon protein
MIVWICEQCGCEAKEEKPLNGCPLCGQTRSEFYEDERPDPEKDKFTEKYDEVIDILDEYTKDCEPEDLRFSAED